MRRAFIAVVVLGMIVALAIGTATATAYPGQAAGQDNSADANALAGNGNLTGQNDRPVAERLWHASRGPGQLERPGGRGRRDRPAGQAEQHRRRDPRPQPRRRRQRPPVQQRRRERAGRQHQPHRPEHRPVPGRDGCAGDRTGGPVRLPVRHPGRGPVEQQLAGRRRPRRRGAGQAEQHGCRDPGAEPGRRRQRRASPTAQTRTRWQATATSPARTSTSRRAALAPQVAGQDNSSGQAAEAGAIALQDKPSNTAVGIRVLSPGDDGNVHQSNSADANALAGNINLTGQNIDQSQGGTAAPVIAPVAHRAAASPAPRSRASRTATGRTPAPSPSRRRTSRATRLSGSGC